MTNTTVLRQIRKATVGDYDSVHRLLVSAGLPTDGVRDKFNSFFIAEEGGCICGAMGLELYGDDALLRSAVVSEEKRSLGIGTWLYDAVISYAKEAGVKRIVLLTNTAESYFARKGFVKCSSASIHGAITTSTEFTGACPSTAVCMTLML